MLILKRKPGESIKIGKDITIMITAMYPDRVGVGIDAPTDVPIWRTELLPLKEERTDDRTL